ncbi:MAG TPA: hypothetical protein VNQ73_02640 [Ilumatobacter sp.]|nr:hypothetical protein [Ilumatobacter sp.]
MRILREYLGGCEELDLSRGDDYEEFARGIVQDYDVADELIERLRTEGCVVVNADNGFYVERYTVLADRPRREGP